VNGGYNQLILMEEAVNTIRVEGFDKSEFLQLN